MKKLSIILLLSTIVICQAEDLSNKKEIVDKKTLSDAAPIATEIVPVSEETKVEETVDRFVCTDGTCQIESKKCCNECTTGCCKCKKDKCCS